MELAIDIGNTRTKIGLFQQNEMVRNWNVPSADLEKNLADCLSEINFTGELSCGWMSVGTTQAIESFAVWSALPFPVNIRPIKVTDPLPIKNHYSTPHTLGIDRIVAVVGAKAQAPESAVLVIDAGTAITYDFATAEGVYLGGGIAPGVNMRFKALHTFTARLPLISAEGDTPLVGYSTETSIRSGVINGMREEISGIINRYRATFGDPFTVFLTGGDLHLFENHLKNLNFADVFLTLKGINHILTFKKPL
ncbi:MAG: type III pantothenate kinase [Bacteroidia bacterium]|nr:type III pantothenate kinase [Bacteroidia bacterium]